MSMIERRARERVFLEQLLDTSKLDNYVVPVPIKADLRKYQQVGVVSYDYVAYMYCNCIGWYQLAGLS